MATLHYKTDEEIEIIRESGKILGKAHAEVAKLVKPGIPTIELDRVAYQFILDNGGTPSFKGFHGFPYTLCISVNENVVHGFPSSYELKEGDIISIDCGVKWNGYHSDSAYTYGVGEVKPGVQKLLDYTKQSLYLGIEQAVVGNRVGDIGFAVQSYVEKEGFSVVRELVGHGLGKNLHEKPEVPNYGNKGKGLKLENNLVIAIEPMINLGKKSVIQEKDGWTIRTVDRMPSAHFEHTVAVKKGKADILTTFEYIEEVLNKK
jgi:methionyl aminopeptidase